MVLDYETGRVVWVGQDRKARTRRRFFSGMSRQQRQALEAVVMDMGDPSIAAVRTKLPLVKIVFDLFRVVAHFSRVIDKGRTSEYRKASQAHKEAFKGGRYLLLRNRGNIRRLKERRHLEELLRLNKVIHTVLILKDRLKPIWAYRSRAWADKPISEWCGLARTVNHLAGKKFALTPDHYRYGILHHFEYPIHTGRLEGVNNKIKFIKRRAYSFLEFRSFHLKINQAFAN